MWVNDGNDGHEGVGLSSRVVGDQASVLLANSQSSLFESGIGIKDIEEGSLTPQGLSEIRSLVAFKEDVAHCVVSDRVGDNHRVKLQSKGVGGNGGRLDVSVS